MSFFSKVWEGVKKGFGTLFGQAKAAVEGFVEGGVTGAVSGLAETVIDQVASSRSTEVEPDPNIANTENIQFITAPYQNRVSSPVEEDEEQFITVRPQISLTTMVIVGAGLYFILKK